jgi:hypothetical protein
LGGTAEVKAFVPLFGTKAFFIFRKMADNADEMNQLEKKER